MKALEIFDALKNKAGQHVLVVWAREVKTLKDCKFSIVKRTAAYVRAGISFANLASVKEGIAIGTRDEVGKLKYGNWRKGFEKYIIDHTPKGETLNVEYVRLYPAAFANLQHPEVEWLMDGVVATYAEVEPYLLASEKRKDNEDAPECFQVRAENVISVGN